MGDYCFTEFFFGNSRLISCYALNGVLTPIVSFLLTKFPNILSELIFQLFESSCYADIFASSYRH